MLYTSLKDKSLRKLIFSYLSIKEELFLKIKLEELEIF